MTNPSPRDSAARKVAAAARAIVAYQIGLPAGCQRVSKTLSWLAPYEKNLPNVFEEYMKAVIGLPIGSERLEWDRDVLIALDKKLEIINAKFRDRIFAACWELIDRFR